MYGSTSYPNLGSGSRGCLTQNLKTQELILRPSCMPPGRSIRHASGRQLLYQGLRHRSQEMHHTQECVTVVHTQASAPHCLLRACPGQSLEAPPTSTRTSKHPVNTCGKSKQWSPRGLPGRARCTEGARQVSAKFSPLPDPAVAPSQRRSAERETFYSDTAQRAVVTRGLLQMWLV